MSEPTQPTTLPPTGPTDQRLWPIATVMATGIFATTFVQIQGLGYLPINHLLEKMGLDSNQAASFFMWTTLPWTLKGFAGLLVDGLPIFGSRRKLYLLVSAFTGSLLWLVMSLYPNNYSLLLASSVLMSLALVLGGTASGGLLVEAGHRFGATGRLSSVRVFAQNMGAALGGWLGGLIADKMVGQSLGWTSAAALPPLICLFLFALLLLKEKPVTGQSRPKDFLLSIQRQLKNTLRWSLLPPALVIFFIQVVPTFRSSSFYQYQTKVLHYNDSQLGWLSLLGYGGALLSSGVYAWWCRRVSLRNSLFAGVGVIALSALPYLNYPSDMPHAIAVEVIGTFLLYLGYLPFFDLAVRSTPKGSEALGYSLMLSSWNLGLMLGIKTGPKLYEGVLHQNMNQLVWINALVTLAGAALILILPASLVGGKEGKHIPQEETPLARSGLAE